MRICRIYPFCKLMQDAVSEPGIQVSKRPPKRRAQKDESVEQVVTEQWTVSEIVTQYPQATEVMAEYGLHCFGCAASGIETLGEGCQGHGFSEEDIENLVEDINHVIVSTPAKEQVLFVSKDAALAIADISKKEKIEGQGLSVRANEDGSFFMEFRKEIEEGEKEFYHEEVPSVKVWASILTLQRIGGATIDFVEGRFKLDMQEGECCGEKKEGECGCDDEKESCEE